MTASAAHGLRPAAEHRGGSAWSPSARSVAASRRRWSRRRRARRSARGRHCRHCSFALRRRPGRISFPFELTVSGELDGSGLEPARGRGHRRHRVRVRRNVPARPRVEGPRPEPERAARRRARRHLARSLRLEPHARQGRRLDGRGSHWPRSPTPTSGTRASVRGGDEDEEARRGASRGDDRRSHLPRRDRQGVRSCSETASYRVEARADGSLLYDGKATPAAGAPPLPPDCLALRVNRTASRS